MCCASRTRWSRPRSPDPFTRYEKGRFAGARTGLFRCVSPSSSRHARPPTPCDDRQQRQASRHQRHAAGLGNRVRRSAAAARATRRSARAARWIGRGWRIDAYIGAEVKLAILHKASEHRRPFDIVAGHRRRAADLHRPGVGRSRRPGVQQPDVRPRARQGGGVDRSPSVREGRPCLCHAPRRRAGRPLAQPGRALDETDRDALTARNAALAGAVGGGAVRMVDRNLNKSRIAIPESFDRRGAA